MRDAQTQVEADEFQGKWGEAGIAKLLPAEAGGFCEQSRQGDVKAAVLG
jgi:hypothetical protein